MQLMMKCALDQKGKQFIFLTPQDMRLCVCVCGCVCVRAHACGCERMGVGMCARACTMYCCQPVMKMYRNCRKMLSELSV